MYIYIFVCLCIYIAGASRSGSTPALSLAIPHRKRSIGLLCSMHLYLLGSFEEILWLF